MAVLLNGVAQLEYDRSRILPDDQLAYLEKMDTKMATGVPLGGELVEAPDLMQKSQFVAEQLYHALRSNKEAEASAFCSYLATRMPDLHQVKIKDLDGAPDIELVFDEEYGKQVAVSLTPLN